MEKRPAGSQDFLSSVVLLSHIGLALAHLVWLLKAGRSSSCWAPIALKNTCFGIRNLKTLGQLAIVRATNTGEDQNSDPAWTHHVELLFFPDEKAREFKQKTLDHSPSTSVQSIVQEFDMAANEMEENELEGHGSCFPMIPR